MGSFFRCKNATMCNYCGEREWLLACIREVKNPSVQKWVCSSSLQCLRGCPVDEESRLAGDSKPCRSQSSSVWTRASSITVKAGELLLGGRLAHLLPTAIFPPLLWFSSVSLPGVSSSSCSSWSPVEGGRVSDSRGAGQRQRHGRSSGESSDTGSGSSSFPSPALSALSSALFGWSGPADSDAFCGAAWQMLSSWISRTNGWYSKVSECVI